MALAMRLPAGNSAAWIHHIRHAAAGSLLQLLLLVSGTAIAAGGPPEHPSPQAETQSPSKSGGKAAEAPADKQGDKPDSQAAETTDAKAGERCDPKKHLTDFELRRKLCQSRLELQITETSEILGNLTGGLRQGALYEGLTDLNLRIDLRRSLHWRGEIFVRAYQIHGRGLTANNIGNLDTISNIEAARTTRLNELWYEHHFDHWRVRVGQQTIGNEFLSPASARLFVNGAFGWPTLPSVDLPSGGPSYPLGTPAVRLRVDPEEGLTLFLGLFNGDPTGTGVGGSQLRDASGTAFRTSDGAFAIGEIRYNPGDSDRNGTYSVGGWWNSERFRDHRLDENGVSLASPASTGLPRQHSNDFSLYGTINQPLLVDNAANTRLTLFARAMGAPGDRNLISLYLDGGLTYKGPFGRADDELGLAVAYARIGNAARGFDADVVRFTGEFRPVRSGEAVLELTYRFHLTGWWQLQPDFQYIFNPGGGIANPNAPGRRIGDAAVLGLRTAITF